MENTLKGRKLGFHENVCATIHECVVIIAHTENHIYCWGDFKGALKCLIDRHPTLRIKLNDYSSPTDFVLSENPYIDPVFIQSMNVDEWKTIAMELANRDFTQDEKSLLRVVLVQFNASAHIMINFHHSMGDGIGGTILIHDLMSFYSKINRKESFEVNSLPLLDNSDNLTFPNGISEEDSKKISDLRNDFLEFNATLNPYVKYQSEPGNFSCIALLKQGTRENFLAIKSLCKQYGITVGSLLMAASFFAFAKHSTNNWEQNSRLEMFSEILADLRKRIDPPLKMENFQCIYNFFRLSGVEVTADTKLWDLAKTIYNKNLLCMQNNHHLYYAEALRDLSCEPEPQQNFNISNIGLYPFNPVHQLNENTLSLSGIHCVGSKFSKFVSYVFQLNSVSDICYSFVYSSNKNDEYANAVFEEMFSISENSHLSTELTFSDILN